jgi:hypothetical protein
MNKKEKETAQQKIEKQQTLAEMELEGRRWKHRRRMAYISLGATIVILFLIALAVIIKPELSVAFADLGTILSTVLIGLIGVVMGYTGASTWEGVKTKKSSPKSGKYI